MPRSRLPNIGSPWVAAAIFCMALVGMALHATPAQTSADDRTSTDSRHVGSETVPQDAEVAGGTTGVPSDDSVEEVVVTGERVKDLTLEERRQIYEQLADGRRFYSRKDYERAFPLLLNTAEHGFKEAQARVGYIYLRGLGEVSRNSTVAIGWLGVAASGNSAPGIRNYFNDIWRQIPERHVPYFEEVVEEYESKYGEQATDVTCELRRPVGSHVKQLSCFFDRDLTLEQLKLYDDIVWESTSLQAELERAQAEAEALQVDEDS